MFRNLPDKDKDTGAPPPADRLRPLACMPVGWGVDLDLDPNLVGGFGGFGTVLLRMSSDQHRLLVLP